MQFQMWVDLDADGLMDPNEPPLPGVIYGTVFPNEESSDFNLQGITDEQGFAYYSLVGGCWEHDPLWSVLPPQGYVATTSYLCIESGSRSCKVGFFPKDEGIDLEKPEIMFVGQDIDTPAGYALANLMNAGHLFTYQQAPNSLECWVYKNAQYCIQENDITYISFVLGWQSNEDDSSFIFESLKLIDFPYPESVAEAIRKNKDKVIIYGSDVDELFGDWHFNMKRGSVKGSMSVKVELRHD